MTAPSREAIEAAARYLAKRDAPISDGWDWITDSRRDRLRREALELAEILRPAPSQSDEALAAALSDKIDAEGRAFYRGYGYVPILEVLTTTRAEATLVATGVERERCARIALDKASEYEKDAAIERSAQCAINEVACVGRASAAYRIAAAIRARSEAAVPPEARDHPEFGIYPRVKS